MRSNLTSGRPQEAMTESKYLDSRRSAVRYLRKQSRELRRQLGIVARESGDSPIESGRDSLIEGIHQVRVASRRLLAALRLLQAVLPRKKRQRWRKTVRTIMRGFGRARDLDVQIEYLDTLRRPPAGTESDAGAPIDSACWPGISRLSVRLEKERETLQPKIATAAARFRKDPVLREMRNAPKGRRATTDRNRRCKRFRQCLPEFIQQQTTERFKELLDWETCLDDASDHDGHHAMRIAAKRLRYTLEITRSVFGAAVEKPLKGIKRVQAMLGDIHDCDISQQRLDAFAKRQRKYFEKLEAPEMMFKRLKVGIDYLRRRRRMERDVAFAEFVTYWRALPRKSWWKQLSTTKSAVCEDRR